MSLMLVEIAEGSSVRVDQVGGVHLLDNAHEEHGFRVRVDGLVSRERGVYSSQTIVRFKTREEAKKAYDRLTHAVNHFFAGPQSADAQAEPVPAAPEPAQA